MNTCVICEISSLVCLQLYAIFRIVQRSFPLSMAKVLTKATFRRNKFFGESLLHSHPHTPKKKKKKKGNNLSFPLKLYYNYIFHLDTTLGQGRVMMFDWQEISHYHNSANAIITILPIPLSQYAHKYATTYRKKNALIIREILDHYV